jgi:hypothetical protein
MKTIFSSLIGLFVILCIGYAQEQPPVQIQKLYPYIGKWEGTGTLNFGGKETNAKVTHIYSKIVDGWGIYVDENMDLGEMGIYKGHNILGYDLGESKLHLYTISNMEDVHDHKGDWNDGNTISLEYNGIKDGKPFVEKLTLHFDNDNEYTIKDVETLGGQPYAQGNIIMKRVK